MEEENIEPKERVRTSKRTILYKIFTRCGCRAGDMLVT
jgi:hypothetical protein